MARWHRASYIGEPLGFWTSIESPGVGTHDGRGPEHGITTEVAPWFAPPYQFDEEYPMKVLTELWELLVDDAEKAMRNVGVSPSREPTPWT